MAASLVNIIGGSGSGLTLLYLLRTVLVRDVVNKWNGLRRTAIKRTKGLVNRRALSRGKSSLKRGTLKPRSKKREKFMKEVRVPLVQERINGKLCDRCRYRTAQDVHEILPRSVGGSMTDDENLADLCRPCHEWVTAHPVDAEVEGFHRFRWKIDDGRG